MNLSRAKELFNQKDIPYELVEYSCVGDFWEHISLYPNTQKVPKDKVISLVICSKNNHKNLELQFNESDGDYVFSELWFGEYAFEAFDYEPEFLEREIFCRYRKSDIRIFFWLFGI